MAAVPQILDRHGDPVPPASQRRRARADIEGGPYQGVFPYQGSDWYSQDLVTWLPRINSPDYEYNVHRDRIVARLRDLVRNDGWAAGSVTGILDSAIGISFRLSCRPDYRALAFWAKGFDAVWAHEYGHAMEALSEYVGLLHGEAISMGMCCGARLSMKRGGLSEAEAGRLSDLIAASGLPTRVGAKFKLEELLAAARLDKKARNGKLRFVLLKRLGDAIVSDAVTDADFVEAVNVCR